MSKMAYSIWDGIRCVSWAVIVAVYMASLEMADDRKGSRERNKEDEVG